MTQTQPLISMWSLTINIDGIRGSKQKDLVGQRRKRLKGDMEIQAGDEQGSKMIRC